MNAQSELLEETLFYKDHLKNIWVEVLLRINKQGIIQLYQLEGTERRLSKFHLLLAEFKFSNCTVHHPPVSPTYKKYAFELIFRDKTQGHLFSAKSEEIMRKCIQVLEKQYSAPEETNEVGNVANIIENDSSDVLETLIRRLKFRDNESDSFIASICQTLVDGSFKSWNEEQIKVLCEVFVEFATIQSPTQEETSIWANSARILANLALQKAEGSKRTFLYKDLIFNFSTEYISLLDIMVMLLKGKVELQFQKEILVLFKNVIDDTLPSLSSRASLTMDQTTTNIKKHKLIEVLDQFLAVLEDLIQKTLNELSRDLMSESGKVSLETICYMIVHVCSNKKFGKKLQEEKSLRGLVALTKITMSQSKLFFHPFKALYNILQYNPEVAETLAKIQIIPVLNEILQQYQSIPAFRSQCELFLQQLKTACPEGVINKRGSLK